MLATYKKPNWDFDENTGYIEESVKGDEYKIIGGNRSANERKQKAKQLYNARQSVNNMTRFLKEHTLWQSDPKIKDGIDIFLKIHAPDNYRCRRNPQGTWRLSEIPTIELQTKHQVKPYMTFYGLNKPKNVKLSKTLDRPSVGPDGKKRATWRSVFLTLSDDDTEDDFIELLTHELAHTAGNHVTYRDKGNHGADFKRYHAFLKEIYYLCN